MNAPSPDPIAPETPRRRGLLDGLFKSTLGCAAFAVGSLVVLVLLLPTILSGTVASRGAAAFDAEHQGRLEIGSATLAWFGKQTLRDVRLLDPAGAQVARARVTLPSILSLLSAGSGKIGAVAVEVEADLEADDAGTTNLQRALAPRAAAAPGSERTASASTTFDVAAFVRGLDLALRVDVKRLAWSDADTRRLGRPFEIQDGVVRVFQVPGAPLVALVTGRIAGQTPGTLEIHLDVAGPIDPAARWPLGRMEAKGRIEGFSTALVDGLAGLSGDLVEVLGPTFALRFDVAAESAEKGTADLELDGANADVAIHARLAGGVVTGGDQPFLTATTPMPRGILERLLRAKLPPNASVTLGDAGKSWTVRVPKLRLPPPDSQATDFASLRPALEQAELDLEVDLPGTVTFETDALRAAKLTAGISATMLTARAAPGQPLLVHFEAALEAGAPGRVRVDATVPDAFTLLAGGPIPRMDAHVEVEGLSTLALGEFAGQGARIANALGPTVTVELEARRANLDGGDVRVRVQSAHLAIDSSLKLEAGVLTGSGNGPPRLAWTPTPEFFGAEIRPFLPADASLQLVGPLTLEVAALALPLLDPATGGLLGADALMAGLRANLGLSVPSASLVLSAEPAPRTITLRQTKISAGIGDPMRQVVELGAELDLGGESNSPAHLTGSVAVTGTLPALLAGGLPPAVIRVALTRVEASALERLAGSPDTISALLGRELALNATLDGHWPEVGTFDVALAGADGRVACTGRVENGRVIASGDQGLTARLQVTPELLRARLGPSLPEGTQVEIAAGDEGVLELALRDFATPIEATDLAARLAGTNAHLEVKWPAISYADAKTKAAGRTVVLRAAKLMASLTRESPPNLRFTASVEDTPPGAIDVEVTALDRIENLQGDGAWKAFRASARIHAENVPTAIVDALAGQDGLLVEALGPRLLVDVQAPDVAFDRGAFTARCEGGQNRAVLAGKLVDGTLVVESTDGLDADVALGPLVMDRVVGRLLPILGKASFLTNVGRSELTQSARLAPFLVNSSDVRFALGSDLSRLSGVFRIDLGTLTFQGLPMLDQLGLGLKAMDVRLPAFTVPIRDGVATYEKLPIRIGGRDVLFDGSVRLTDGEMSLATRLPLAMFGQKFERELGKIRDFVPPDTEIPIILSGTWNKPRVDFQKGFLQGLLEKAGGKLLEEKAGDLLDDLFGGKKKKEPKKDG